MAPSIPPFVIRERVVLAELCSLVGSACRNIIDYGSKATLLKFYYSRWSLLVFAGGLLVKPVAMITSSGFIILLFILFARQLGVKPYSYLPEAATGKTQTEKQS